MTRHFAPFLLLLAVNCSLSDAIYGKGCVQSKFTPSDISEGLDLAKARDISEACDVPMHTVLDEFNRSSK